ncbi:MAG: FAD:protein FMN transferase [Pirellulaceae bacterium]
MTNTPNQPEPNPAPRTDRRDFLRGRSAVEAFRGWTERLDPEPTVNLGANDPAAPNTSIMSPCPDATFRLTRRAMACEFGVFIPYSRQRNDMAAAVDALNLIDQLEDQLTVYREHSEVCHINREAAQEYVEVEPRLFQLFVRAQELFTETAGAFDITSGTLTKGWGFYRRQGRVPTADELSQARLRVGMDRVELDGTKQRIRFCVPGMELNLGGIGKGYALDRAMELLRANGVKQVLLHGGRSSVLAAGNPTSEAEHGGWQVELRHPQRPDRRLGRFHLIDQALGTSGHANQYFYHQSKRYGHILDPRTGVPADGLLSCSVVAPDATTADAVATGLFVMSMTDVESFARAHPELGIVAVRPGAVATDIRVELFNIEQETFQREES